VGIDGGKGRRRGGGGEILIEISACPLILADEEEKGLLWGP